MMKKLWIPLTLMAYCLILLIIVFFFIPELNLILFPINLVGIIIAFGGFILMGKARDKFRDYNTTLKIEASSHLIKDGVFSKTRNPMYLGMFILIFGIAIFSTNLLSIILPFIFLILVNIFFVKKEENLLALIFGEEYSSYKRKVRRWI